MKSALIVFNDSTLGGKLAATPLISALARKVPGRDIGVACYRETADFMRTNPYGITVHEFEPKNPFNASCKNVVTGCEILQEEYDTTMVLPMSMGFYVGLLHDFGIGDRGQKVGSRLHMESVIYDNIDQFPVFKDMDVLVQQIVDSTIDVSFHFPLPYGADTRYVGDSMLEFLRAIGENADDPRPEIWSTREIGQQAEKYLAGFGVDKNDFLLGINLCGWAFSWEPQYAGALTKMFNGKLQGILGGRPLKIFVNFASDQETIFSRFCSIIGNSFPVVPSPLPSDYRLSAELIKRCSYFVTAQTGSAVMAQARNIDTPSTVIYPEEVWEKGWKCPGSRVVPVISLTGDLNSVPLEEVYKATEEGIGRWS